MGKGIAFAEDVIELIKKHHYPEEFKVEEALQALHTIVTAFTFSVVHVIGTKYGTANIAASGGVKPGGPGPHGDGRMDLLTRFCLDASYETKQITDKAIKNSNLFP